MHAAYTFHYFVSNFPPELNSWRVHPFLFLGVPSLSYQSEENTAEQWADPFLPPPCSCSCCASVAGVQALVAAALKPWSLQKHAANTSPESPLQAETAQGGIKDTWDNMRGINRGLQRKSAWVIPDLSKQKEPWTWWGEGESPHLSFNGELFFLSSSFSSKHPDIPGGNDTNKA